MTSAASDPAIGVLLLQLGTPASPGVSDVRKYLREFLSDPRVLDIPAPARALLLNAVILPFRPRKSAEAYEKIWTEAGSPLLVYSEALAAKAQSQLGDTYRVQVGMRYGDPSISSAINNLVAAGCRQLVVLPMFPQYASASGGSALAKTYEVLAGRTNVLDVSTVAPFYDHAGFLSSAANIARPLLESFNPDHTLFSYHGLPESQIKKSDASGSWCLTADSCCDAMVAENSNCYRAQCFATTRGLVALLGLPEGSYSTTFQSRLAGQKWIEPYTDKVMPELTAKGIRRLAVLTPAFVADCLETIEEIGIRGKEQWADAGGDELILIPCVNDSDEWATAVAEMIRNAVPASLES